MTMLVIWMQAQLYRLTRADDDRGFVTAENLGVAAFGIVALSAIFLALKAFGLDVISWIRTQTGISGG